MSKGYVYILTNPSMAGIVKIGKTTRTVQQRADELWQTGVPEQFIIAGQVLSPDCAELERNVHQFFADKRVSPQREFFKVPEAFAVEVVTNHMHAQLECFVQEFAPRRTLMEAEFASSCDGHIQYIACEIGASMQEVADLLTFVDKEEFRRAIARRDELYARVRARREAEEAEKHAAVVVPLSRLRGLGS